jgi:hypothetical protein
VASPLVRANLEQLGHEYTRRVEHWSKRRVLGERAPPQAMMIIAAVGLVGPLALASAVGVSEGLASLRGWPMVMVTAPLALPSAWYLARSMWQWLRWGGLGVVSVILGLILLGLRPPTGWAAWLGAVPWGEWSERGVAVALILLGMLVMRHFIKRRRERFASTNLITSMVSRTCPDCGAHLMDAPPGIKRDLVAGFDIGPRACPSCLAPWPLLPPPVGLRERNDDPGEPPSQAA